jgi:hypothetical protein
MAKRFALWQALALKINSNWRIALALTCALGIAGLFYVAILVVSPPPIVAAPGWPISDKRWLLALYGVGIGIVYFPLVAKKIVDLLTQRGVRATTAAEVRSHLTRFWAVHCMVAIISAFAISSVLLAPPVSSSLERPLDKHEVMHLGPIQRIDNGAIPYVEAQTQYGPGHQIVSYHLMRSTEFSVVGFRASHCILNMVAEGIRFSLFLIAFGWVAGLLAIVGSLVFSPIWLLQFTGWGVLFRWLGPVIVGIALPKIIWSGIKAPGSYAGTAAVGATCGVLAWFSQENFSTSVITAGLIVAAAFGRGRLSPGGAARVFGTFIGAHVAVFLSLTIATVGFRNLSDALYLYFHSTAVWTQGIGNTPWTSWESAWTIGYFATPYVIIVLTALALYCRRTEDETELAKVISMAAAAAALVPITLLRSDKWHFLGPAIAMPALIALSVTSLPQFLCSNRIKREIARAIIMIVLAGIYFVPAKEERYLFVHHSLDLGHTWNNLAALYRIWTQSGRDSNHPSLFERRLGYTPDLDTPCCDDKHSYRELKAVTEEVHRAAGGRAVYIDAFYLDDSRSLSIPWQSSLIYFLSDLKVGTSMPDPAISRHTRDDVERLRDELTRSPPSCVVTTDPPRSSAGMLIDYHKMIPASRIGGLAIFCDQTQKIAVLSGSDK